MRVTCRSGHFAFYPRYAGEILRFQEYFDTTLSREEDYWTFPFLVGAPRYSIVGKSYLGLPAGVTYEGRNAWNVMAKNGFVYSIADKKLVSIASVTTQINPPQSGYYFLAETMLVQPGSVTALGKKVLSYDGEIGQDYFQLRLSEVTYV
jgi:hypothetical protein